MEIKMDVRILDAIIDSHLKKDMDKALGKDEVIVFEKMSKFLTKYDINGPERMEAYLDMIEIFN